MIDDSFCLKQPMTRYRLQAFKKFEIEVVGSPALGRGLWS
jgi:hypothetical protein